MQIFQAFQVLGLVKHLYHLLDVPLSVKYQHCQLLPGQ
jgi:hypothetical protein